MYLSLSLILLFYFIVFIIFGNIEKLFTNYTFNIKLNFLLFFLSIVFLIATVLIFNVFLSNFLSGFAFNCNQTVVNNLTWHYFSWPYIYVYLVITILSVIFCFVFNIKEINTFLIYISIISVLGLGLFLTNSIIVFFLIYESLLIPSFLILYKFSKTRKSVEAAFLMFFWTQFGALFLIFGIQYIVFITGSTFFSAVNNLNFSNLELYLLLASLLIGFGVKFPIWPFYEWLPKAHVEASTNFSIFLSGVLVKFAFFGFVKFFLILGMDHSLIYFKLFLLIGLTDVTFKLYFQFDLKKLIAYSTVLEMHWLAIALISGQNFMFISAFAMLISHALISSSFFMIVDFITRRFKTRLTSEISGIFYLLPSLYTLLIIFLITFLGFPGSLFFIAEFLFFSTLLDTSFFIFFFIFFIVYLIAPTFFFKNWFFSMFNHSYFIVNKKNIIDIDYGEVVILLFLLINLYGLGLLFQFFF